MSNRDLTKAHLEREAQAAAALLAELNSDNAELNHDMVEGETAFFEVVQSALDEIGECEIQSEGLAAHIAKLEERKRRADARAARIKGLIDQAFQVAEIKSHKFTTATITTKKVPPKTIVTDESALPSRFFAAQPPKLDRKALTDALKGGEHIDGASLSNGGTTIQIRRS